MAISANKLAFPDMRRREPTEFETIRWNPPAGITLGLETLRTSELRRRGGQTQFARPQRVEFFTLMAPTEGGTQHVIDFAALAVEPGTWLLSRPGQMQRFDFSTAWEGWHVVFVPAFVPSVAGSAGKPLPSLLDQLNALPTVMRLAPSDHEQCIALVERMHADAMLEIEETDRNALSVHQLSLLLIRLKLGLRDTALEPAGPPADQDRVAQFRKLIEAQFSVEHRVAWYASEMGCTVKTLGRATAAVAGRTPKAMIIDRLILEAKRRLVYETRSIQHIAHDLGFSEPAAFVKLFKNREGLPPRAFRARGGWS